jgi:hypothetical protein
MGRIVEGIDEAEMAGVAMDEAWLAALEEPISNKLAKVVVAAVMGGFGWYFGSRRLGLAFAAASYYGSYISSKTKTPKQASLSQRGSVPDLVSHLWIRYPDVEESSTPQLTACANSWMMRNKAKLSATVKADRIHNSILAYKEINLPARSLNVLGPQLSPGSARMVLFWGQFVQALNTNLSQLRATVHATQHLLESLGWQYAVAGAVLLTLTASTAKSTDWWTGSCALVRVRRLWRIGSRLLSYGQLGGLQDST